MLTFPVKLWVTHHGWAKQVCVQAASRTSCFATCRYTPKNLTYETAVRLHEGKWTTTTMLDNHPAGDDYPRARGYEIAEEVLNWWMEHFEKRPVQTFEPDVAAARATWLNRATHKLLTEVGTLAEQVGALHVLASNYHITAGIPGAPMTIKGASWATAAYRNLERDLPDEFRRGAVILLVDLITGYRDPANDDNTAKDAVAA